MCWVPFLPSQAGLFFVIIVSSIHSSLVHADTLLNDNNSPHQSSSNSVHSPNSLRSSSSKYPEVPQLWDSQESLYILQNPTNRDYYTSTLSESSSRIYSPGVFVGFTAISLHTPIQSGNPAQFDISLKFHSFLEHSKAIAMKVVLSKPEPMVVTYLRVEDVIRVVESSSPTSSSNSLSSWQLEIPGDSFSWESSANMQLQGNNQQDALIQQYKNMHGFKVPRFKSNKADDANQKELKQGQHYQQQQRGILISGISFQFNQLIKMSDEDQKSGRLTITIEITQHDDYFDLTLICGGSNTQRDSSISIDKFSLKSALINFLEFSLLNNQNHSLSPLHLTSRIASQSTRNLRNLIDTTTEQCPPSCLLCSSGTSLCVSCVASHYLWNYECTIDWPVGTYCNNQNWLCYQCIYTQKNCGNCDQAYVCTSCVAPNVLDNGVCTSSSTPSCSLNCETCTSSTVCSTCVATYYLYNDGCTLTPPSNTLCTTSPMACITCDATCGTCSGTTSHCDSCFTPGQYFYNNACTATQPPSTTCNTNLVCTACPSGCSACSGSTCTTCISGYFRFNGSCYATKQDKTFCWADKTCEACPTGCQDCVSSNNCQSCISGYTISNYLCVSTSTSSCHSDCATCSGTSNTDCLSCSDTSKYLYNKTCYDQKQSNTYCSGKSCFTCLTGCDTCSDGNSCDTCLSTYFLYQNICTQPKPNHAYCDTRNICEECHETCATCESNNFDGCLSCQSDYPYLINKECKQTKPSAVYCNGNNECTDCPMGCSDCTDGTHCSSCIDDYFLFENLCHNPKPTQTFCDSSRVCQKCHNDCKTCEGASNDNCLSCQDTNKYLYQKKCYSSAPSGVDCDMSRVCADCPTGCATCSNATTCLTCYSNYYFFNNQCTSAQPSQTYCNSSRICSACHADCATCSTANSNTACLTCQNTSKYQFNGSCLTTPNPDTFCDPNNVCSQCPNKCATCTSLTSCTTCITNNYLYQNQCTSTKPTATVCDTGKVCSPCHTDCGDCTAANSSSSCTACADSTKYLYKNSCESSKNSKTYCDTNLVCLDCPSLCETCSSNTICQTCVTGNFFYQNFCYDYQPSHTYCDTNSKICNQCHSDCETCSKENSKSSCLTCYSGKYLYNSVCYETQPTGTWCAVQGAQVYYTCVACPTQCATCDGNLVCLTCSVIFPYFTNNDCVKYPDCQNPCASCELGTASTCSTCPAGFILKAGSNGKSTCMCEKKSQTLSSDGVTCKDKETGMSADTTESMKSALDNTSVATSGLAVVFAASSIFTGSGTAMLSQAFTLQKIFYLQLTNLEVPSFLKLFLQSIDGLGILKKYRMFNLFQLVMDTEGSDLDYMYKDMEVRGGIFSNAGGALSVEIVLGLVQSFFIILIGQSKESIAFKVYSMVFCGMMLQMLPLISFAIVDTISIELILIPDLSENYEIGVQSMLLLLCFVNAVVIFLFFGKIYFHNPVNEDHSLAEAQSERTIASSVNVKQVQSLSQLKLQNNREQQQKGIVMKEIELQLRRDTIAEKFPSRTYMFFYYIAECVLFPLVSTIARGDFIVAIILLSFLQILELCYTLKVRPFFNKITNVSFIIEQIILLLAFLSYSILGIMISELEQDETSTELPQSIIVASFLVAAFSLLAILVNPVIQFILIYQSLRASQALKTKKQFLGKFTNFEMSVFASAELARKQNIEFPLAKQESWSINQ